MKNTNDIPKYNVLKTAEKYTPDAIWNIECKVEFLQNSIDCLKELKYL